jgi:hypothetical protein
VGCSDAATPPSHPGDLPVGPWTLRLQLHPGGSLAATDDPAAAALAWLLNAARDPDAPLAALVESGEPFSDEGVLVAPLSGSTAPSRADAETAYREAAGGPPPPDALLIGLGWHPRSTVVGASDLRVALHALRDLRTQDQRPPPDLFIDPDFPGPPIDLSGLDRRARQLDRSVAALGDRPEPPAVRSERDRLLSDLRRAGLGSADGAEAKRRWLREWNFDTLLSLYAAALERLAYAASLDRARAVPPSEPVAVSLDLFRSPPAPPAGHTTFSWIGVGEGLLRYAPSSEEGEGSVFSPDPAGLVVLRWRREEGRRCLVALGLEAAAP